MEILIFSLNATMPVIICMAVGVFLGYRHLLDSSTINRLSSLCFKLFLPMHIFSNVYSIDFDAEFNPRFIMYAVCGVLALFALLLVVMLPLVKDRKRLAAYLQVGFRSNYMLLGNAIVFNMFGDTGGRIAAMLIPVAVIFFNMLTVIIFTVYTTENTGPNFRLIATTCFKVLKNPLIIACLVAVPGAIIGLRIPDWAQMSVKSMAQVAPALSLIVLGAQIDIRTLRSDLAHVFGVTSIRLVAAPLVFMPVFIYAGFRGPELASLFVLFAAPCTNTCAIMAKEYDIFPLLTAQVVALTTILSGFTIFLGITLLRYFALF